MSNTSKTTISILAVLVLGLTLFVGGWFWGRTTLFGNTAYGPEMMWANGNNTVAYGNNTVAYGRGMMSGSGYDIMGNGNSNWNNNGYGRGMMGNDFDNMYGGWSSNGYGTGMMGGGYGRGMISGEYSRVGMMDGYFSSDAEPLSLDENHEILEAFLDEQGWSDELEIAEIMIFDNQAYAELVEIETGIGAYEVLINPETGEVVLEPGANMMWNLKYGMHAFDDVNNSELTVSESVAVALAQEYLDADNPGLTVSDHADAFYGYYTLHTLRDGEIVGMLSVNGYTGDVLLHTWHGEFIEMSEDLHD